MRRSDEATKRRRGGATRPFVASALPPSDAPSLRRLVAAAASLAAVMVTGTAGAQSLDDRLDEEAFLRGLTDLGLVEVLEHYVESHPPADRLRELRLRLVTERVRLMRAGDDRTARDAAVDRILETRRVMLQENPNHQRRAVWMADQAEDLLFELLPRDASGLTVLFGISSPAQRERAAAVAREMVDLTEAAEGAIDRAILEIESTPGYRDDEALQLERRRLAREDRDRRIPFLRGIAVCLDAALNEESPAERRALEELAVRLLRPLRADLPAPLAQQAGLYAALALARLERWAESEEMLGEIEAASDVAVTDWFPAGMTRVLVAAARDGPERALAMLDRFERDLSARDGGGAFVFRLLVADQRLLLRRRAALARDESIRARALRDAYDGYLGLLDADTGVPREAMYALCLAKLGAVVGDDEPLGALPPLVSVARAEHLARGEAGPAAGIPLLEAALARDDLDGRERAAVLFSLARALHATGQRLPAARRYLEVAAAHPAFFGAVRSIELAAALAQAADREDGADGEAAGVLGETLAVMFERYADAPSLDLDRWRYVAGRLALRGGDWAGAAGHFEAIRRAAREWPDARFMCVQAAQAGARDASDAVEKLRRNAELLALIPRVRADLENAAASADETRGGEIRGQLARLRVIEAEAQLTAGHADAALVVLGDIELDQGVDSAALAAALRLRIDACQALHRPEDARQAVRRFMEAAPDRAGRVLASMLDAVVEEVEALLDESREDEARDMALREGVPLADLLAGWMQERSLAGAEGRAFRERAADAFRLGRRFADGLRLYDDLLAEQPNAAPLLFGRAECLFGLGGGRDAEAIGIYKRLAAAGPGIGSDTYWPSQLRILQLLDRAHRNTDRIVPRIRRLRLEDPNLGGERYRRGFERLEVKYG